MTKTAKKFLRTQFERLEKERAMKIEYLKKDLKNHIENVDLYNERGINRLATAIFGEAYVKKYFS